jgi:hypothetical protein
MRRRDCPDAMMFFIVPGQRQLCRFLKACVMKKCVGDMRKPTVVFVMGIAVGSQDHHGPGVTAAANTSHYKGGANRNYIQVHNDGCQASSEESPRTLVSFM